MAKLTTAQLNKKLDRLVMVVAKLGHIENVDGLIAELEKAEADPEHMQKIISNKHNPKKHV